jgi:hypothetical protein
MTVRNPKQDGSVLYDCIPQVGPCPNGRNCETHYWQTEKRMRNYAFDKA